MKVRLKSKTPSSSRGTPKKNSDKTPRLASPSKKSSSSFDARVDDDDDEDKSTTTTKSAIKRLAGETLRDAKRKRAEKMEKLKGLKREREERALKREREERAARNERVARTRTMETTTTTSRKESIGSAKKRKSPSSNKHVDDDARCGRKRRLSSERTPNRWEAYYKRKYLEEDS